MMISKSKIGTLIFCAVTVLLASPFCHLQAKPLPEDLTAAILVRMLEYSDALDKRQLTVHVVGDEVLANRLKGFVGSSIGSSRLVSVTLGELDADSVPDVIFLGMRKNYGPIIDYTRKNKVLSVCSSPQLGKSDVSLTIFDDDGVPGILLNPKVSRLEGISWKPEVLELVEVAK